MSNVKSFGCLAAVLAAGTLLGGTCVWTGASGRWTDTANWRDGVVPSAGDTVYVSNTVGNVSIDLDPADGVSLASIRFEGASPVELTGHELRLTGDWSFVSYPGMSGKNVMLYENSRFPFFAWTSAVDVRVPVLFDATGTTGLCHTTNAVHFYETVRAPDAATVYVHNGFNANPDEVAAGVPAGFKNAYTYFHGDVLCPKAKFQSIQAPCGFIHCLGRIQVKNLRCQGWASCRLYLYSTENAWETVQVDYGSVYMAKGENVFPSDAVFALGDIVYAGNESAYNLGGYDQTIDRLDGVAANVDKAAALKDGQWLRSSSVYNGGTSTSATLTMKGTADGTTTLVVRDQVSLVWDPVGDYALTFTNRASTTTGSLTVKGGTFRLAGDASFANATSVRVASGATFDLATSASGALAGAQTVSLEPGARISVAASAVAPFGPSAILEVGAGAVLSLPAGAAVRVAAVCRDGVFIADGVYSGSGENAVDWISGPGTVTVDAGNVCIWKQAASGRWSDAANWVNGNVPTAASAGAYLLVSSTSDYVATVDAAPASFPTNLVVRNLGGGTATLVFAADTRIDDGEIRVSKGGRVRVDPGAKLTYFGQDPAGLTTVASRQKLADLARFTVEAGGEWRVAGGTCVFTNVIGMVQISGKQDDPGRFVMEDGYLSYTDVSSEFPIRVGSGGRLEILGGTFSLPHHGYNHSSDLKVCGGEVVVSNAVLDTTGKFVTNNGASIEFGTGTTVFDSGNQFTLASGNKFIRPGAAGETARVVYRNQAQMPKSYTHLVWMIGGVADATGVLDWEGDDSGSQTPVWVGYDDGEGELNVNRGLLRIHSYSLRAGLQYSSNKLPASQVVGRVSVAEGAALYVEGSQNKGWGATSELLGIVLGRGLSTPAASGHPFVGRMDVAGHVTNNMGQVVIGLGSGEGTYVQNGGQSLMNNGQSTSSDKARVFHGHTVLGLNGGIGHVIVSNGTFRVRRGTLFVGGCSTDEFSAHSNDAAMEYFPFVGSTQYPYPFDRHDGTGTFTVVGGAAVADNATVVGGDGTGILEMRGSAGSFTTKDLVLSNATESVVRFVAGADGFSPVTVQDRLTLTDGARVEVDLTDYAGKASKFTLASFAACDGNLADVDVSVTDGSARPKPYTLVKGTGDLSLVFMNGTTIIFR